MVMSPVVNEYRTFGKDAEPHRFYVPLFTDAEMDYMAKKIPSDHNYDVAWQGPGKAKPCTSWKEVAYFYGNVPRIVFGRRSFHAVVIDQLNRVLGETRKPRAPVVTRLGVNDWLVEHVPSPGRTCATLRFRRGYVSECIADI